MITAAGQHDKAAAPQERVLFGRNPGLQRDAIWCGMLNVELRETAEMVVTCFTRHSHLTDRQGVFRIPCVVDVSRQTERFAEDARFEPAPLLADGHVTVSLASENFEFEAISPSIHEPVFGNSGSPVEIA